MRHAEGLVQSSHGGRRRRLATAHVKTTTWLLQMLRTMIEDASGSEHTLLDIYHSEELSYDELHGSGSTSGISSEGVAEAFAGAQSEAAVAQVQNTLNDCGVTALCIDLVALGMDQVPSYPLILLLKLV